jgi:hypothetical protein
MLRQIAKLIQGKPIQQPDPISGEPGDGSERSAEQVPRRLRHAGEVDSRMGARALGSDRGKAGRRSRIWKLLSSMCVLYEHELATEISNDRTSARQSRTTADSGIRSRT